MTTETADLAAINKSRKPAPMLSHRPSIVEPNRKIGQEHKVLTLLNNENRRSIEQAMISKSMKSLGAMKTTGRAAKQGSTEVAVAQDSQN